MNINQSFLSLSFFIVLFTLISCKQQKENTSQPPNILFIAVDDLRPELNCYGQTHIHSPNIDRLAAGGTRFERTYCQVPVCGASRASLLSGVRPTASRFVTYRTRLSEDFPGVPSLPEHFKNNGYTTLSRGKIFHHTNDQLDAWSEKPWAATEENEEFGWLDYVDTNSINVITKHPDYDPSGNGPRLRGPAFEAPDVEDHMYKDGKLALKAIEDLNNFAKNGEPFFLALGFLKPHLPFNAPKKYWDLYDRETLPMSPNNFIPENAPDAAIHSSGELRNYGLIPKKGPVSADTARILTHGYYACISYTDAQIGKVLDALDELGLRENTIVVLWGDHGWNLQDHTMWCKHANFETSMRAPLIISVPGFQGNQASNALTEFVDIYPTLCDLTNIAKPQHLHGESLVPLLQEPNQEFKDAIYSRFHNGESIKTDRYVYTEWWNSENREMYARMLYDHQTDPNENVNVAEQANYAEAVDDLSRKLAEMREFSEKNKMH